MGKTVHAATAPEVVVIVVVVVTKGTDRRLGRQVGRGRSGGQPERREIFVRVVIVHDVCESRGVGGFLHVLLR